jgi:hypothetical protein
MTTKNYYDKGLLLFDGVRELIDVLENKMITNITYSSLDYKSETGVNYSDVCFKVTTAHMCLGELVSSYPVE